MWYGLQFDLGVSLVVIFVLILIAFIAEIIISILRKINLIKQPISLSCFYYFLFLVFILCQATASIGDIILYKYWESIFSIRAFPYLKNIGEMLNNVSVINLGFVLVVLVAVSIIYHFIFQKFLADKIEKYHSNFKWYLHFLLIIVLIPISFLTLRGGLREIPRNQSDAFFCQNRTYNLATINSTWNFFNVFVEHNKYLAINPYQKMDDKSAASLMRELFRKGTPNQIQIFNSANKPNIVLITLEGVSAELLKIHNTSKSNMPFLESLIDSSYYFTKAYSTGFRTEQGIAALLSGVMATPYNNITDNVNALAQIPSIVKTMKHLKYGTQFLFGGNVEFANMRAYLTEMKFDTILDIQDFEEKYRTQQLGVPDEFLFKQLTQDFTEMKPPFFIQVMTQSTHEPYDIPNSNPLENEKTLYRKSAQYLDLQLRQFFEAIKHNKNYNQTIFILCSDHSHRLPEDNDIADTKRYHIPLLIYSPLLKNEYRGYKDSILFNQQNFPATLSYLMNWKEKNYLSYSLNHFSNAQKFTFSSFVNGYVFQRDTQVISYDYIWRPYDTTNKDLVRAHGYPQAILQTLVDEIRGKKEVK